MFARLLETWVLQRTHDLPSSGAEQARALQKSRRPGKKEPMNCRYVVRNQADRATESSDVQETALTPWKADPKPEGEVLFIRGRLKFGEAANSAPFPSALVVFQQKTLRW